SRGWSSDVCSSDLGLGVGRRLRAEQREARERTGRLLHDRHRDVPAHRQAGEDGLLGTELADRGHDVERERLEPGLAAGRGAPEAGRVDPDDRHAVEAARHLVPHTRVERERVQQHERDSRDRLLGVDDERAHGRLRGRVGDLRGSAPAWARDTTATTPPASPAAAGSICFAVAMGDEIAGTSFTREQRTRYREKVRRWLDVFERRLADDHFDATAGVTGLEIELNLVSGSFQPAMANAAVLERIADPAFQTELG